MRYILNDSGYIEEISFTHGIVCNNKTCIEYTGSVPEGYESLAEWSDNANINAYKIVDENLVYDSEEDTRLQNLWASQQKTNVSGEYDSLPVGSIINFDGDEVPVGYEEVSEINNPDLLLSSSDVIRFTPTNASAHNFYGGCYYYKKGTKVHLHLGLSGLSDSNINIFTLPKGYRPYTLLGGVSQADCLTNRAGYEINANGVINVNSSHGYMLADI